MDEDFVRRSDVHKVFQPKYAPAINRVFATMIDSVPAADVVPVRHARWVDGACSDCGFFTDVYMSKWFRYCPNCGALMSGGPDA